MDRKQAGIRDPRFGAVRARSQLAAPGIVRQRNLDDSYFEDFFPEANDLGAAVGGIGLPCVSQFGRTDFRRRHEEKRPSSVLWCDFDCAVSSIGVLPDSFLPRQIHYCDSEP